MDHGDTMARTFIWHNDEDNLWYVSSETTRGNSWANEYQHLAGGFESQREALAESLLWKYENESNSFVRIPPNTASSPTAPASPAGDDSGSSRRGGLC